jgi:hypothetical protein
MHEKGHTGTGTGNGIRYRYQVPVHYVLPRNSSNKTVKVDFKINGSDDTGIGKIKS